VAKFGHLQHLLATKTNKKGSPWYLPEMSMAYAEEFPGICRGYPWHLPWMSLAFAVQSQAAAMEIKKSNRGNQIIDWGNQKNRLDKSRKALINSQNYLYCL
jgi:hypothetical protein